MKWIRIIFLIISIILSLIIIYAIINSWVSHKYEIEGRAGDLVDIQWVEEWMLSTIMCLKYFLYYIIVTIIYLLISIFSKKK
jgi:uncharacterized protein YggT (Ycf19 family)